MMKNIAIPLLVASSANAQLADRLAKDRAVPRPVLIAPEGQAEACTDADVEQAKQDLQSRVDELGAAEEIQGGLVAGLDAAKDARAEAVTAVTEKQAEMAQQFANDDAAREAVEVAQKAYNVLVATNAAATLVDEAAKAMAEQADVDRLAAIELKVILDAAALSAANHVAHEESLAQFFKCKINAKYPVAGSVDETPVRQACTSPTIYELDDAGAPTETVIEAELDIADDAGLSKDLEDAEATLTATNAIAGFGTDLTLADNLARTEQDLIEATFHEAAGAADYTWRKSLEDAATAWKTAATGVAEWVEEVPAAATVPGGFGDDVTEALSAYVANNVAGTGRTAMAAFVVQARVLSSATMEFWTAQALAETEAGAWTAVDATAEASSGDCSTGTTASTRNAEADGLAAVTDDATCKAECAALASWLLVAADAGGAVTTDRQGLPNIADSFDSTQANDSLYCYGYSLATKTTDSGGGVMVHTFPADCLLHQNGIRVTASGWNAADAAAGATCTSRVRSTKASAYVTAYTAAFVTEAAGLTLYTAATAEIDDAQTAYATAWDSADDINYALHRVHLVGGNPDPAVTSVWGDEEALTAAAGAWKGDGWTEGAHLEDDANGLEQIMAVATDARDAARTALSDAQVIQSTANGLVSVATAQADTVAEELGDHKDIQDLADADVNEIDAEIIRLTAASILATADGGPDAAAVLAGAIPAYTITAVALPDKLVSGDLFDALAAQAITNEALNGEDGSSGPVAALTSLRSDAAAALATLAGDPADEASTGLRGGMGVANKNVNDAKKAVADAQKDLAEAVSACEAALYDTWAQTLVDDTEARDAALQDVEDFLDAQTPPARGAVGARCEKALSNGTFRPARGEDACAEDLCCAAARIPTGNGWRTVETCQTAVGENLTMQWVALPRVPLADSLPAAQSFSYTCIQGAQKLAAAATAAAAAVYMLA